VAQIMPSRTNCWAADGPSVGFPPPAVRADIVLHLAAAREAASKGQARSPEQGRQPVPRSSAADPAQPVSFGLNGTSYEIDLGAKTQRHVEEREHGHVAGAAVLVNG
jgi:hypothetical protein